MLRLHIVAGPEDQTSDAQLRIGESLDFRVRSLLFRAPE